MNKEYAFDIDSSLFNVFSSEPLEKIVSKYQINKYYELNQIHSAIVNVVGSDYQTNLDGDAMITNLKDVGLVIRTADCVSLILYDEENEVLSVVHSGWKGTLNSIVIKTLEKMHEVYNTDIKMVKAYLYPSIRKCHYEIGEDVYLPFKERIANMELFSEAKENNKYYIDLQGIIINDLKQSGVSEIFDANICTHCNHDEYYSYRFNHTDKRNYLVAMLRGKDESN